MPRLNRIGVLLGLSLCTAPAIAFAKITEDPIASAQKAQQGGDVEGARQMLRPIIEAPPTGRPTQIRAYLARATTYAANSAERQADEAAAAQAYAAIRSGLLKRAKSEPAMRDATAQAVSALLEVEFARFEAIKLAFPASSLRAALVKKAKILGEASERCTDVIGLNAPKYSGRARVRLAQLYAHLADALIGLGIPKELSKEEGEVYRSELMQQATPLLRRARQALDIPVKSEVEPEWLVKGDALRTRLTKQLGSAAPPGK